METVHPKTAAVLSWFEEISKIPRKSGEEAAIREWLMAWARTHAFEAQADAAGNLVIRVPGTAGLEHAPVLVVQGHLDMVCEKTPDSPIDPAKQALKLIYDGDWLKADRTTLGADNGIAIALSMAMVLDPQLAHPPLELLFTVEEETGLDGAKSLAPDFLRGRLLLNVDSEDEGVFTIGCAGGRDTLVTLSPELLDVPAGWGALRIAAGRMKGGHSGVDIAHGRANAIRVVARAIDLLHDGFGARVALLKGGSAHNAIPRDAEAIVVLAEAHADAARATVAALRDEVTKEHAFTDPELTLAIEPTAPPARAFSDESTRRVTNLIFALPHGVSAMSSKIAGLVETSNNLATIELKDGRIEIVTSQRSSVESRLVELTRRIHAVARLAGAVAENRSGYPAWEPNWDSKLLETCKVAYRARFGRDAKVEIIHAGLECGIIGSKFPGMDMISFGPTLKDPHCPDERLKVSDIGKIWDFMEALFVALR